MVANPKVQMISGTTRIAAHAPARTQNRPKSPDRNKMPAYAGKADIQAVIGDFVGIAASVGHTRREWIKTASESRWRPIEMPKTDGSHNS